MAASRTPPTNEEAKAEEQKQQERASAVPNDDELVLKIVGAPTITMWRSLWWPTAQLEEKGGEGGSGGGVLYNMMHGISDFDFTLEEDKFQVQLSEDCSSTSVDSTGKGFAVAESLPIIKVINANRLLSKNRINIDLCNTTMYLNMFYHSGRYIGLPWWCCYSWQHGATDYRIYIGILLRRELFF